MQSSPLNFRRAFIWIVRLGLAATFLYAAYSKLFYPTHILWPWFALKFSVSANLNNFVPSVDQYKILSPAAANFFAHLLPFLEAALGLLLLIGWRLRIWLALSSALLALFLTVLTRAYLLHMDIKDCGCFASDHPEPLNAMTLLRDTFFLAIALLATYFAFVEARKPHPWAAPQSTQPSQT